MEKNYSRTRAEISLRAIGENLEAIHRHQEPGAKVLAVLKADGYGHGAIPIAEMIEPLDYVWGYAVATAQEALELRQAGLQKPILILGYTFPEDDAMLVREDIRPTIFQYETARRFSKEAGRQNKILHIHLALDTGMGRIGFPVCEESVEEIQKIQKLENLRIEGIFTHFARADETDRSPAMEQLDRYERFEKWLKDAGVSIPIHHCSNSAGIMRMPEAHKDMTRAGIILYGIYPSDQVEKERLSLVPAMGWKASVSYVKEVPKGTAISYGGTYVTRERTKVATIPVGYADGYPRSLSNKGWVLIHGQKAPLLGRVCMDQFMVDVTKIPNVKQGDEVTLMGRDGEEVLSVDTLAELSGRFPYEFVCDVGKRVPRIYLR